MEVFNILSTKLFQFYGYQNKINFSNFSKGVYILKITLKNGSIISKKILKR
uniref:T9SS type A sorting domain-containing protein n=1 Tax=uncultured Polaribacter sp. TaxID=174711 RepID=UPI00345B7AF5